MKSAAFILIAVSVFSALSGQRDEVVERITSLMVENGLEQNPEFIQESIHELLLDPLNLNTSSETDLLESRLFNPYQVFGILKHRREYGDIFSIYELTSIPGFHVAFLQDIQSLVCFADQDISNKQERRKILIFLNTHNRLPLSAAHLSTDSSPPIYPGSPVKLSTRLKIEFGEKLVAGLAYEKDAGESAFYHWKPEHMTGYVSYKPASFLRNLTLGNYKIHTGLGLVHGAGFTTSSSGVQLNGFRTAWSKAYASTAEYDYYRGILAELGWSKLRAMFFCSYKPEDISLYSIGDSMSCDDLYAARRETGLHRSREEINGRDLARQRSAGFSLNRTSSHFNIGISGASSAMIPSKMLLDSIPFWNNSRSKHWNLTTHAITFGEKYEAYTELAVREKLYPALIIGGSVQPNAAFSIQASFRHFHPNYMGQVPSAYAISSGINNETGFHIGSSIIPLNNVRVHLYHDLCYFPESSYNLHTPAYSSRSRAELRYSFTKETEIYLRFTSRITQEEIRSDGPGPDGSVFISNNKYRLHYAYAISEFLILSGRLELSYLNNLNPGTLMYQQAQIRKELFSLTYRCLLFDIDDWENRIYVYEPGVRYSFSFPSYYGSGVKNSLVATVKVAKWLVYRMRLGHVHYANQWGTGSGHEVRKGDQQFECEFQLQLSF